MLAGEPRDLKRPVLVAVEAACGQPEWSPPAWAASVPPRTDRPRRCEEDRPSRRGRGSKRRQWTIHGHHWSPPVHRPAVPVARGRRPRSRSTPPTAHCEAPTCWSQQVAGSARLWSHAECREPGGVNQRGLTQRRLKQRGLKQCRPNQGGLNQRRLNQPCDHSDRPLRVETKLAPRHSPHR